MKKRNLYLGILAIASTTVFVGCGGNGEAEDDIHNVVIDTNATDGNDQVLEVEYAVPTPNELFEIVKLQGGEQKPGLVNPLENRENYVETKEKAKGLFKSFYL